MTPEDCSCGGDMTVLPNPKYVVAARCRHCDKPCDIPACIMCAAQIGSDRK